MSPLTYHREPNPKASRRREASTFEVFARPMNESHGVYDTLDEARGCVAFDRLAEYEIWQGDHIVLESDGPHAVDDLSVLRDFHASQQRVVAEEGPISVRIVAGHSAQDIFDMGAPPDETSIAALADIIRNDPIRAATRWLTLEGQVRLQRAHLEALEQRMGARV